MLQFKVNDILKASGHQYPATWLVKHCGFTMAKAYKMLNGKQRSINLKDVTSLCENLSCTPNDLMYWKETGHTKVPASHPCMTQLTPPDKNTDWALIFKKLTAQEIRELNLQAVASIKEKEAKRLENATGK